MPTIVLRQTGRIILTLSTLYAGAFPIAEGATQLQTRTAIPRFEVASIKPCIDVLPPNGRAGGVSRLSPGRLSLPCQTVKSLIQMAHDQYSTGKSKVGRPVPIEGGPAWINSVRYTIEAKAEDAQSDGMMMGPMLQTLLDDRFKLKIHRETTEVPVYLLTVVKGGLKLQPFKEGTCTPRDLSQFPPPPLGPDSCRFFAGTNGPNMAWIVQGATIDEFCKIVLPRMDRPVIDRTGLTGRFNFPLEYMPDATSYSSLREGPDRPAATSDDPAAGPSIFTALQQQLGLKLEPAKGPADFLVIDRVERPSEN
jgi:uncharacterized protein (TIGR03435 family)